MLTFIKQFDMWFKAHFGDDTGATAVEYGLMVALIAGVIVAVVFTLGGDLKTLFTNTSGRVQQGSTLMAS